jgi:coenzyme F420-reducing hydrogenase alpha subunit
MARDHADVVKQALALKKTGNALMSLIGGREIHPINVRIGGFYKVATRRELATMVEPLQRARDTALAMAKWVATFDFPDVSRDYELVALKHPDEYGLNEGRLVSNRGLDISAREYPDHFEEIHVAHSNALQARIRERGHYMVGPLARFALNFDQLTPGAKAAAREAGLSGPCTNPYRSIVVRAVEVVYACEEALRLIAGYAEPDAPFQPAEPRAGVGHAATEAPRGMLYHRYRLAEDGSILDAVIVPPTSQNQATIEEDLTHFINDWVDLPDPQLKHRCEQTVRNYDPCISCATHFLDLRVDRG